MRKKIYYLCFFMISILISCSNDDSLEDNNGDIDVENYKHLCQVENDNIISIQGLFAAALKNDYIIDLKQKDNVYIINFVSGTELTVICDKGGYELGGMPVIRIGTNVKGEYGWKIGEKWLTDSKGNIMQLADVTPKMKVDNDYWYVLYDKKWEMLGKVGKEAEKSVGLRVESIDNSQRAFVSFVLTGGILVNIPKKYDVDILLDGGESYLLGNRMVNVAYTLTGTTHSDAKIMIESSKGVIATVVEEDDIHGHIAIIAQDINLLDEFSKVSITISDGINTSLRTLSLEKGIIRPIVESYEFYKVGGKMQVKIETNMDYTCVVEESAREWLKPILGQRVIRLDNLEFEVSVNETGLFRKGEIILINETHAITRRIVISQKAEEDPGLMIIKEKVAIVNLDCASNDKVVAEAIKNADLHGVTDYVIIGDYKKMKINAIVNPFKTTGIVQKIDFSGVTNWTIIPEYAFNNEGLSYFSNLKSLIFPETIFKIEDYAFIGCSALEKVSFPSVAEIGTSAFSSCSALREVSFPSATDIGASVFSSCSALEEVSFPSVTEIGASAFSNCSVLKKVSFPSVTDIEASAFRNCSALEEISFPSAINIGSSVFSSCSALKEVVLPHATEIGKSAFINCSALVRIIFPIANTIGESAFINCTTLTEVEFPVVKKIDYWAFRDCISLREINFPSVTNIGWFAFDGCVNLRSVTFPKAVEIGVAAFNGCRNLEMVVLPSVTDVPEYAFSGCLSLTVLKLTTKSKIMSNINSFGFNTESCNLYLCPNKEGEVNGKIWREKTWKSINFSVE